MTTTLHIIDHVTLVKSFADNRRDAFLSYLMEMALLHAEKLQEQEKQDRLTLERLAVGR